MDLQVTCKGQAKQASKEGKTRRKASWCWNLDNVHSLQRWVQDDARGLKSEGGNIISHKVLLALGRSNENGRRWWPVDLARPLLGMHS